MCETLVRNILTIEKHGNQKSHLKILSTRGEVVGKYSLEKGENRIDLSYLAAGTYTLLVDGGMMRVVKVD